MKRARKTKIICTIGPATNSPEMIEKLLEAGMDVARLNFSHGDHETHRKVIESIRRAGAKRGKQVGILLDLSGPKIRLGTLPEPVNLTHHQQVTLSAGEQGGDGEIPVNYPYLAEDVAVGARILLADGLVELSVDAIEKGKLRCTVLNEGVLSSHKGVNLPLSKLRIPAFTAKDQRDLEFGLSMGVHYIAMSFIRSVADLAPVREILARLERPPYLLAKMEKPEAIAVLDDILAHVDGAMVARGDLGVEMPLEQLPIVQKKIISATRRAAKPVITATQMLRSMIANPRPTRAEVTDTANAILDGTSAVMLSEETAVGDYPVEAVRTLDQIARVTEAHLDSPRFLGEPDWPTLSPIESSITRAACMMAEKLGAACIVVVTQSGSTARHVSRFRQQIPIVAITSEEDTLHKLLLSWGIIPVLEKEKKKLSDLLAVAIEFTVANQLTQPGDRIIFTSGYPSMLPGSTDMLKVLTVPDGACLLVSEG